MRFTLTRPKTKSGISFYYRVLLNMSKGKTYNALYVHEKMTFGALRQAGLINRKDNIFSISDKGMWYIKIVESSNKVNPEVLRAVMGGIYG